MSAEDRYATTFYLLLPDGTKVYPVRMKNRDTGQVAFRVSKAGNTKEDSVEIENEVELLRHCESGQYRVRVAAKSPGASPSLILPGLAARLVRT